MEPSSTDAPTRSVLRRIHIVATVWFVACAGYLIAIGLRQAGFNWWLAFSLSGYSTGMVLILVCLYLFALYRGVGGGRRIETEHPLTSTNCYMGFYVSTPLLGSLLAAAATIDSWTTTISMFRIAMGTLKTTFLVWVAIDPLLGMIEMLLPASRRHRSERIQRPTMSEDKLHS